MHTRIKNLTITELSQWPGFDIILHVLVVNEFYAQDSRKSRANNHMIYAHGERNVKNFFVTNLQEADPPI